MIKVGIIGGAGYTAGELIRLLINHPCVKLEFVHSSSQAGKKISDMHTGLNGECNLEFSVTHPMEEVDLLFLCSAHGKSREFWASHSRPEHLKVIDLAQDFRSEDEGYVYGLPELNRERISRASSVANPGCFATAIQLALLPLAANALLPASGVYVTALTGSTGAGVKPSATTHFSWRNDNISVYKPFTHQHLIEIGASLQKLQPGFNADIAFVPMRGDFARGIFASVVIDCPLDKEEIEAIYSSHYASHPFAVMSDTPVSLKDAVNTNKAVIHLDKHGAKLLITVAEDNLLKGASGQAVQNMNIMYGFDEKEGLRLKALAF